MITSGWRKPPQASGSAQSLASTRRPPSRSYSAPRCAHHSSLRLSPRALHGSVSVGHAPPHAKLSYPSSHRLTSSVSQSHLITRVSCRTTHPRNRHPRNVPRSAHNASTICPHPPSAPGPLCSVHLPSHAVFRPGVNYFWLRSLPRPLALRPARPRAAAAGWTRPRTPAPPSAPPRSRSGRRTSAISPGRA